MNIFYTVFDYGNIKEMVKDRLTLIYNESTLNNKFSLFIYIPSSEGNIYSVSKLQEVAANTTIWQFDETDFNFWNTKNLYTYNAYCLDNDNNVFIGQNKLLSWTKEYEQDFIFNGKFENDFLQPIYLDTINFMKSRGYEIEVEENFECMNFDCCYFNAKVKKYLLDEFNKFKTDDIFKSETYLSNINIYIILTILLKNGGFSSDKFDSPIFNLTDKCVEMYSII